MEVSVMRPCGRHLFLSPFRNNTLIGIDLQNFFAITLTTPLNNLNMSNTLVSLIPVLSSANYAEWAPAMEAYLLSLSQ